jgi:hypothetical protein
MTALQSLSGKSPQEAFEALTLVTQLLLPNPGIDEDEATTSELTSSVLAEIRQRYKDSQAGELYELLSSEITRSALAETGEQQIRYRLGEQGYLWSNKHRVSFSDNFLASMRDLNVRKAHVEDAVHNADGVRHLLPEKYGANENALSLFVKFISKTKVPHVLLILGSRKGDMLNVYFALRIIPSVVPIQGAKTPLDILRAFVEKYGVDVFVGDEIGKFFLYKSTDKSTGIVPLEKRDVNIIGCFIVSRVQNTLEVGAAFAIDILKYQDSLKEHGFVIG